MNNIQVIESNLKAVEQRMQAAAQNAGRAAASVSLVAVTKTQPVDVVRQAISAGAGIIGENYIQESREKFDALIEHPVQWHFIGHLQRNKAKYAVRIFDLIHSVDSVKLAKELDKQARKVGKIQDILVQVNVSGETTKSGVDLESSIGLIKEIAGLSNLRLQGLMTMPPFFDAPDRARPFFTDLSRLRDKAVDALGVALPHLSMGMTGDFEVAIQEGATLVRVGTAIFGERG